MTIPSSATASQRRDPTRIGQARPSHLISTTGVGAIVDLPSMSVIVRGLDAWNPERQETVFEPRLLDTVRGVLGPQVRRLRHAPWDPSESDDPWTRVGVPVTPFPRWVRCPRCYRLGPLDPPGQFELVHRWGRRPDLAKIVHARCLRQQNKRPANLRACIPARFMVVCEKGHLDDFPYVEFVHANRDGGICDGPQLSIQDAASTLGPHVTVKCECGVSRNLQEATGRQGQQKLPSCRGRHPHLQQFTPGCDAPLRLIVLGASNLWFGVTASALHLPQGQTMDDLVAAHWEILGAQPTSEVVRAIIDGMDVLRELRGFQTEDVWACIEKLRGAGGPAAEGPSGSLRDAEWELLCRPTTERQDTDFRARATDENPFGYERLIDQVVQVSRLREVRALLGFTRLSAPDREELQPPQRVSLSRGPIEWVPAVEQRGEGIFLQLREDLVTSWVSAVEDHNRFEALRGAYRRWTADRGLTSRGDFPVTRFTLIHTFSHMLIRQVALECGYSSASLRERLYLGTPEEPTAGVLLSTAASDSEGTLGGLVALGEPRHLERLLGEAFTAAEHCSSDPLCAEHMPSFPSAALHCAACHACLFVSETSCEAGNRWLDRGVLVDLTGDGFAFQVK